MTKPVVVLPLAESDIRTALIWYRGQAGSALADRFATAVAAGLRHVGRHAGSGSLRYADMLALPGLRFWSVARFPYLVFYVERSRQVDVWRVLHAHRDLPAWLNEGMDG